MNKSRLKYLFLLIMLVFVFYPSTQVQAKVHSFQNLSMEVTLKEDTLLLTSETPSNDPLWAEAKISDPSAEIKTMKQMGVQALLYDPSTATTVRVLSKQTTDSRKIFHLSLLSKEELTTFLNSLFTAPDENTTYSMEQYPQSEIPFYHLSIQVAKAGTEYSEVIYGTIANGYSISYDSYVTNSQEPMNEAFLKELVADTHFTEFQDKAEVEREQRSATTTLIIAFAVLLGIIIVWIIIRRRINQKQKLVKKQKSEALAHFFTVQRQREEQEIKDVSVFINRTTYSEEVIKTFYTYNLLWKHLKLWIVTAIVFLVFLVSFYTSNSIWICIIAIVALIVFIYVQYFQAEKVIIRETKAYKSNKSNQAVFTFYDDYYTLSGLQSSSKYPYLQITEVKEYKDYIYLYLGSDRAHYLKKDGFDQDVPKFLNYIKEHSKAK